MLKNTVSLSFTDTGITTQFIVTEIIHCYTNLRKYLA